MTIEGFRQHALVELVLIRQMRSGNAAGVGNEEMSIATLSWSTAWRLAVVLSAVTAALGAALYHFLGVQRPVLVLIAAVVALNVGMRLPAVERPDRINV